MEQLRNATPAEFVMFPQEPVKRMHAALAGSTGADYMHGRGFDDKTLNHFEIGYSDKKNMVVVPMHDPTGMLIGFVGRSVEGKRFQNSDGLPKAKTAWNFHRARSYGDTVIIVESSFDAMRIHQAGYPNVIALLGGSLSRWHIEQLNKTFTTIIIMTDFVLHFEKGRCRKCNGDCRGHRPGRDLGWQIAEALPFKKIRWAIYDDFHVFPFGKKDATDCTDAEIAQMLQDPVTSLEYRTLDLDAIVMVD
jgi:hypothetical protein